MRRHLRIIAHDLSDPQGELFEQAPPDGVQQRLGLIRAGHLHARRRALLVAAVSWTPIVVFEHLFPTARVIPHAGMHVRYLIAAPLLVLAESVCGVQLTMLARRFLVGNLVTERDRPRFHQIMASSRRLLGSRLAEAVVWIAAYAISTTLLRSLAGGVQEWSQAMWWNAIVSLPLLLALLLGWAWRLVIWTRLLTLIARLDLRLVASHPDRAGGLGFVAQSLRAFAIVAFACATIVAGAIAPIVVRTRTVPTANVYFNAALLVGIVAVFALPLLVLVPILARTYRRGVVEYGELAGDVGRVFEAKWVTKRSRVAREVGIQEPDFSATTDLYQVVSNVYAMRFIPISLSELLTLVVATFLPFLPLLLFAVPIHVILGKLKDLLL